jgi:hypothetical protein
VRPIGVPLGAVHPSTTEDRPVFKPLRGAGLPLLALVVLAILLYESQFSGALQWTLGLVGLGVLAAAAWRRVLRGTAEPDPLVGLPGRASVTSGDIETFSRAARRAARGLPFSQVVVSSRARSAFLEHLRLTLGLSPEAVRAIETDPAVLRRTVGDEVLEEFLHLQARSLDEQYSWVLRVRARGGFAREFRDVLDRMEAWR